MYVLYACKLQGVHRTNSIVLRKTVILSIKGKTHNFDMDEVMRILELKHTMVNLNYLNFDARGFCICDQENILNYYKDCPFQVDSEAILAVLCFIIALVLVSKCLHVLICTLKRLKKKNSNQVVELVSIRRRRDD
jgi:hypothetical protein